MKYDSPINIMVFRTTPISEAVFLSNLNKAMVETMSPEVTTRRDNPIASNMSISMKITELMV